MAELTADIRLSERADDAREGEHLDEALDLSRKALKLEPDCTAA